MTARSIRWLAIGNDGTHLGVTLLHGAAHDALEIGLSPWQNIFVIGVILIAPLVAGGLLFTRFARLGAWLLAASMAGALLFGAYHHYGAMSNDHVSQTPDTPWGSLFRVTAALLIVTEIATLVAALAVVRAEAGETEGSRVEEGW